jgi:hypothetical protein
MIQPIRWWQGGVLALCLLTGCTYKDYLHPDNCSTIPAGALPRPNGTSVREMMDIQAANAAQDDFVIYKHYWAYGGDGTQFGPFGAYQWNEIVKRLPTQPYAVIIQPEGNPALDEVRRVVLVNALFKAGIEDAPRRVVIAHPQVEGLYGQETRRLTTEMFIPPWSFHHHGYNYAGDEWGREGYNGGYGGAYGGIGMMYGGSNGFGSINRWTGNGIGNFSNARTFLGR